MFGYQNSFGQNNNMDSLFDTTNFESFPNSASLYNFTKLYKKIQPSKDYDYWEFVQGTFFDTLKVKTLFRKGKKLKYFLKAKKHKSYYGFCLNCKIELSPNLKIYIVAFLNNETHIIDSRDKLKEFIGRIDNIEEVALVAFIEKYEIDECSKLGGSYYERENDYLLHLLSNSSYSKNMNEVISEFSSVRGILNKSGELNIIDKMVYKEEAGPWILH